MRVGMVVIRCWGWGQMVVIWWWGWGMVGKVVGVAGCWIGGGSGIVPPRVENEKQLVSDIWWDLGVECSLRGANSCKF